MSEKQHRNPEREKAAAVAAEYIRERVGMSESPIGLVLGTGWGNALRFSGAIEIPFSEIPGFSALGDLKGHDRTLVVGTLEEKMVLVLRGRVHLNEAPHDPEIAKMVRLQAEMLCQLGTQKLILTNAAGALTNAVCVGDVVVIDGFVTVFAPTMPLFAGEFCNPEDTLNQDMRAIASQRGGALPIVHGGYAMVRGPFFEGRRYDKKILAATGASVVGMSTLPEACIAALYGVQVLALSFVTNDDKAEHSHEENLARARIASTHLGSMLLRTIRQL